MKTQTIILTLALLIFCFLSCSKDGSFIDKTIEEALLDDSNQDEGEIGNPVDAISFKANDDEYLFSRENEDVTLDILENDEYVDIENVTITETSSSDFGEIIINEDNTISFVVAENIDPNQAFVAEFTYSAAETYEDGSTSTDEGIVVIINDPDEDSSDDGAVETDSSFVNFSEYGAVGDGVADDTQAISRALASEAKLIADANATYKITSGIGLSVVSNQIIEWNNSTVNVEFVANPAFFINKNSSNGGTTTMRNVTLDGTNRVRRMVYAESRLNFVNVDIQNINQGGLGNVSAAAIYVRIKNDADSMGEWNFIDSDVSNIVGTSSTNCAVASNLDGSVNGFLLYWDTVPSQKTTITFDNCVYDGFWGDDAGGMFFNSTSGLQNTDSGVVVKNSTIKNSERRAIKGFSHNLSFLNCTFQDPEPSDSRIQCGTKSGLFVIGASDNENIVVDGCTFISTGYDGRVIPIALKNWQITNSEFIGGAYIAMTDMSGSGIFNGTIECNDFGSQGYISEYTGNPNWTDGSLGIGGNSWGNRANDIRLASQDYFPSSANCPN